MHDPENNGWLCFCIIAIGRATAADALDWTPECASVMVVPDGVTTIGDNAFHECSSLTSITVPNSVTTIESEAFRGCTSLVSITVPHGVIIAHDAFHSDTTVTYPNGERAQRQQNVQKKKPLTMKDIIQLLYTGVAMAAI